MGIVNNLENGQRKRMSSNPFVDKLNRIGQSRMRVLLYLNPIVEKLPLPIARYDDPFLPFGKAIIGATGDLVCGYIFDLASYLVLGGAGIVALERTIRYIPENVVSVLHGPFWGTFYAPILHHTSLGLDALTIVRSEDRYAYAGAVLCDSDGNINERIPVSLNLNKSELVTHDGTLYTIVRDDVLYVSRLDDYAEQARAALLRNYGGEH